MLMLCYIDAISISRISILMCIYAILILARDKKCTTLIEKNMHAIRHIN